MDADDTNTSLSTLISDWEKNRVRDRGLKNSVQNQADIYRQQFFKDIWNVTSELLFAGVSGVNDFDIAFVPRSNKYDFDFIVEGYPVQVKSLNTSESVISMASAKQRRKDYVDSNDVTIDLALRMVLEAVSNKFSEVDHALSQGARIIFMNGTSDESGQYFSQFCFGSDNPFPFERSLTGALDIIKAGKPFFPLIFCSTGIRLRYLIYTVPLRVPLSTSDGR